MDLAKTLPECTIIWKPISRISNFSDRSVTYIEHEADFHKIDAVLTHGGIFLDFDVLLINSTTLSQLQEGSECVMNVDAARLPRIGYFYNAGFFSCVKNSPFLALWKDNYFQDFKPYSILYNSGGLVAGGEYRFEFPLHRNLPQTPPSSLPISHQRGLDFRQVLFGGIVGKIECCED